MKRISWLLIVPLMLAAAAAPLACVESLNFSLDTSAAGAGGTGSTSSGMGGMSSSTSSSSTTGSSMSTGGEGGGPHECDVVGDCKNEECRTATACTAGLCVWMNKAKTDTVSQLYGDCKTRQCDGNGGVMTVDNPDTKDTYDWGDPCYMNSCMAFPDPIAVPEKDQKTCTTPWNSPGHCSMFKCIQCVMDMECGAGSLCVNSRCVLDTCTNGMVDSGEIDIDCGGLSNCGPCPADSTCMFNGDCQGTCDMGTMKCLAPSCSDGALNGDESDTDCGGSCAKEMTPKLCMTDQKCLFPGDCESGVCKLGICLQATCADYTQNGDETGIDCGGTGCDFECATP